MGLAGKRRFGAAFAVLAGVLVGCAQPESTKLQARPPSHVRPAPVVLVSPRPQSRHLVLVEPARRARLSPRMGGQLIELSVTEQQEVVAGEVLAKLAAEDSRGSLISARASIDRIKESLRDNETELGTAKRLAEQGVESARAVERLQTQRTTLEAQLREAKGQLLRAKDASDATTIEAPFAGTVTSIETELGEYLSPAAVAIVISQLDPLALEVPLTEREVAMGDAGGLTFTVTVRGEQRPARLAWIAREADAGSSTFPARLLVDNPDGKLRAGESAEVAVLGSESEPQTAVPMTAVRWAADRAYVLRLRPIAGAPATDDDARPNATVQRVEVTVADDSEDLVTIRGVLAEGDRVVAAGPTKLIDGDEVVVVDDPEPTLASPP